MTIFVNIFLEVFNFLKGIFPGLLIFSSLVALIAAILPLLILLAFWLPMVFGRHTRDFNYQDFLVFLFYCVVVGFPIFSQQSRLCLSDLNCAILIGNYVSKTIHLDQVFLGIIFYLISIITITKLDEFIIKLLKSILNIEYKGYKSPSQKRLFISVLTISVSYLLIGTFWFQEDVSPTLNLSRSSFEVGFLTSIYSLFWISFYIFLLKLTHYLFTFSGDRNRFNPVAFFRFILVLLSRLIRKFILKPSILSNLVLQDIFSGRKKTFYSFNIGKVLLWLLIFISLAITGFGVYIISIGFKTVMVNGSLDAKILFFIALTGGGIIFIITFAFAFIGFKEIISLESKTVNNLIENLLKQRSVNDNISRENAEKILCLIERAFYKLDIESSECSDLEFERGNRVVNDFIFIVYWIVDSELYSSLDITNQIILACGAACRVLCEKLDISSLTSTELSAKIYPLVVDRFNVESSQWPRYKFYYQYYLFLAGNALIDASRPDRINYIENGILMLKRSSSVDAVDAKVRSSHRHFNLQRFMYYLWTNILILTTDPKVLDKKHLKFIGKNVIFLHLGRGYRSRIYGDIDDNQSAAIRYLNKSIKLSKVEQNKKCENMAALELGSILMKSEKYKDIISAHKIARRLFLSNAFSLQEDSEKWIELSMMLGTLCLEDEIFKNEEYNNEKSFVEKLFDTLFAVLDARTQPRRWAQANLILSEWYLKINHLEKSLFYSRRAFDILDLCKDEFMIYWAEASAKLGLIYAALNDQQNTIIHLKQALEIFQPAYSPTHCLQTGRALGDFAFNRQDWETAIYGYDNAILAIEQSRYWATSEATKRELIANSLDIYQNMVQACINHQDYAQALLTVERSKSRTLLELLDSAHLYPKNATDAQKQRISDLRRQIAIYQQQLAFTPNDTLTPATEKHPNQSSPETLIRQQLQAANQQFQDLLTELDDPNFTLTQQVPAQLPDLRRLLLPQTALIEWYLPTEADSGFYAFLVTRRDEQIQITPHHFSAEDREHLDQALLDYRSDYGQDTWKKQLPQRLETLSAALQLPRLLTELSQIQHLILIPHRELHLIPLHALPVSLPSPSRSEAKPLQDWFPVQYAPSCQILNNLQQRPPLEEPSTSFFALQNPTQDLTYADFEVEVLRRLFNPQRVLSHDEATKTALEQPQNRAFLQQSRYVHFSCHGEFSEAEPLNAYLRLANREKLTFQNIFTSLDIPNCRLLILSACKTGLVETPPTDDYVGLASAFFFAGTRTVVGSLWEAEEFSAALLMIRLYQELPHYTSVMMALRAAQGWLRTISRDGVLTWLRDELKLEDSELKTCEKQLKLFNKKSPFTSARYWAPFTVSGQLDRTGTSPQHHQS